MKSLHVWVAGRVQGVFFRESTRQTAIDLGLTGWVKNLADGRVEALFRGDKDACTEALRYVHDGPPMARVDHVDHRWEDSDEEFTGFEVRF